MGARKLRGLATQKVPEDQRACNRIVLRARWRLLGVSDAREERGEAGADHQHKVAGLQALS